LLQTIHQLGEIARDALMKAVVRSNAFVYSIAIAVFVFASAAVAAQSLKSIELNEKAFTFAMELIKEGQVVADGKGAWTKHRPSADEENEFIRIHGFAEYAKWHLGIDRGVPGEYEAKIQVSLRRFQKCSLVRAARGQSQSPPIWLRRHRKRGGRIGAGNEERLLTQTLAHSKLYARFVREILWRYICQAVKNASINSGKSSL
jgi:hypothetical protein